MKKALLWGLVLCLLLLPACRETLTPTEPPDLQPVQEQPVTVPQPPAEEPPAIVTEPKPETSPSLPVSEENTCTLSVRCDTIWENTDRIDPVLLQIMPPDGILYPKTSVAFSPGESAFDLLKRELNRTGIPLEFSRSPIYDSVYVEGIGNLYEFDCGELSGWMYMVNGTSVNVGASSYRLTSGDVVEWVYTCDLGADVGL